MKQYNYNGNWYTVKQLSELSGIAPATIRDRLRRGYPVEQAVKITATNESVERFSEASWWEDWVGMSISDLHKIYWKWSVSNGYTPLPIQGFSRHLFQLHPNLKTVPIRIADKCHRMIRLR
jgi:hypothetical protein